MKKVFKRIILIDLDGVLNEYKGVYDENYIPRMKVGAKEFLKNLSQKYIIKIFTTRNSLLTAKWLIENKVDKYVFDIVNKKDSAFLFIDDRCLCFNGNFDEVYKKINDFKVYWKE